ncbi:two-component system response regulator YesN [Paenibacillus cellulosilyticus]|uniref:Two-component system response regulator YesN n=1 Tax=Paenibacillus cellulosilyticus TaxID=375489 RepID=A0A2V2YYV9_9BACL|nr:response regulator [Paenibacillus cellulosilyticus]PWV98502.1 two-component system response regulator YesN [Paenibacillus cellulosilyticus]QKS44111.1 response regulator [Paenibacillus cellulosilyticus]
MLEVLIVDDIPSQVDSIAATIPKDELGIGTIHKAYSGEEALQLYREHNIHIVITDIRMPEMSGVELIREIREMGRKAKIIVISGYADFEYAQSVVPYNTSGYLMKPVNPDQLRVTLGQLSEDIANERKLQQQQQRDTYALRESLPVLRNELLNRLLYGNAGIPLAELERKLFLLNVPFPLHQKVGLFIVRLEGKLQQYERLDRELIEYAVTNMAEELFRDDFHLWFCRDHNEYLVFLVTSKDSSCNRGQSLCHVMDVQAAALKKKAEALLNGSISIILAQNWSSFPEGVPELYRSVIDGMRMVEEERQSVFLRFAGKLDQVRIGTLTALYRPPLLIHLLDTGNWAQAEEKLIEIFAELKSVNYPPEHANEAYFAIANAYQYMAHKRGKLLSEIGASSFGLMPAAPSLSKLEKWAFMMLGNLREQSADTSDKSKGLVDKVHAFIEKNINDNLSLQTIASHVNLHPAYLSRAYRAETGNNLSDYILRYRMELASYLLRSSDKKIYEVAQVVGYQAVPHFIKLFKAFTNMTPQEFRDRAGVN